MPVGEIETKYKDRQEGSESKLNTIRDGFRILAMIGLLVKEERPVHLFSFIALAFAIVSLALGYPVISEYLDTGLVPRFPTAILASGLMLVAVVNVAIAVILGATTHMRREMKRLHYLNVPSRWIKQD